VDMEAIKKLVDRETPSNDSAALKAELAEIKAAMRQLQEVAKPQVSDYAEDLKVLFNPDAPVDQAAETFLKLGRAAGRPEAELQQIVEGMRQANTSEESYEEPHEEPQVSQAPEQEDPYRVYAREAFKRDLQETKAKKIDKLISNDDGFNAMIQLKREIEGDEAADKAIETFKAAISRKTNEVLDRRWSREPQGTPLNLNWIDDAAEQAYRSEVDFMKTVVVDPGRVSKRAPDAGGQASIFDAEPIKAPDPALLQQGREGRDKYLKQGEAYLRDRSRRDAVRKASAGSSSKA
jgi:hypothetical protein